MQIKSITSLVFACVFAIGAGSAVAAQDADNIGKSGKPLTTQQLRMKNCNAEAREQSLKGDDRKAFMSTCLKGGSKELAARDEASRRRRRAPRRSSARPAAPRRRRRASRATSARPSSANA